MTPYNVINVGSAEDPTENQSSTVKLFAAFNCFDPLIVLVRWSIYLQLFSQRLAQNFVQLCKGHDLTQTRCALHAQRIIAECHR